MLRQAFRDRLKEAMKARDSRTVSTVRLILAGLKERDVAARGQGNLDGLSEAEIQRMLQGMIKQRRESIALYRQGNRPDLAQQESEEIGVVESFLPRQLDENEIEAAARTAIDATGATTAKDLGKVMGGVARAAHRRHRSRPRWCNRQTSARMTQIGPPLPSLVGGDGRGEGGYRSEVWCRPTSPFLSPRWAERGR
jgi:uncharacterized protein YqeY